MSAIETKWTKGPLHAHKPDGSSGYVYVSTEGRDGDVATCWSVDNKALETAQLFAAAPELFEAARFAREQLDHIVPGDCWSTGPRTGDPIQDLIVCPGCAAIAKIDAALAKALGEE